METSIATTFSRILMKSSEWRSSLKGMETPGVFLIFYHPFDNVRMEVFPERDGNYSYCYHRQRSISLVRMEVFPERDGNTHIDNPKIGLTPFPSEWRSSLKGMETLLFLCRLLLLALLVRMEVFPERDGN